MDLFMKFIRRHVAAMFRGRALPVMAALTALLPAIAGAAQPRPWEIGMQPPASPVAEKIQSLHDLVLVIITAITVFVALLLLWVLYRYSAKRNATPSQTSHNTLIEVLWTVIPILILVVIAIPSFRLVYFEDRTKDPALTIKVTGHQWFWEYTYPDQGNLDFSSYIVPDDQLKPGQPRLLTVDNQLVIPAGKDIRILTTSGDVIHSFFIPSLGVQRYAIPGRTIETWVRADKPGVYYGECNQICGENHSRMPISVRAIPADEFQAWVEKAKKQFAENGTIPAPASVTAAAVADVSTAASATPADRPQRLASIAEIQR
jgi:cytochrome c oxidase subunit 2